MAQGLPTIPVLLWLAGDQLRAVFDHVVVAEYRCLYNCLSGYPRLKAGLPSQICHENWVYAILGERNR